MGVWRILSRVAQREGARVSTEEAKWRAPYETRHRRPVWESKLGGRGWRYRMEATESVARRGGAERRNGTATGRRGTAVNLRSGGKAWARASHGEVPARRPWP